MKRYTNAERATYRTSATTLIVAAHDADRNGNHSAARVARRTARRYLRRAA